MDISTGGLPASAWCAARGCGAVVPREALRGEPDPGDVAHAVEVDSQKLLDAGHAVFNGVPVRSQLFGACADVERAADKGEQGRHQRRCGVLRTMGTAEQRGEEGVRER